MEQTKSLIASVQAVVRVNDDNIPVTLVDVYRRPLVPLPCPWNRKATNDTQRRWTEITQN